jgi:alpha-methylacyl-CoA racemase
MGNPLLAGVRILDLTRLLPGPFCTLYLAQLGADVVKIEHPDGGDYARRLSPDLFDLVNRGKRSVALDLQQADAVAAFHRLVETADVVVESFRPGVMERLGCGYEVLRRLNPRLVYVAITGYGQTGPYRDAPGHDMNYCAYAGVLDQLGGRHGAPVLPSLQIADVAGGSLTAAIGLLAALHGARTSGVGCFVDASMLDGTLALQQVALSDLRGEPPAARALDPLAGALPNYRLYRCRDGRHLAVAALEPKFFRRMLQRVLLSLPRALHPLFAGLSARLRPLDDAVEATAPSDGKTANAAEPLPAQIARMRPWLLLMHGLLSVVFRLRTRDRWAALLGDADCCVSPVLSLGEALGNEQVLARGMVEHFRGRPAFASPFRFDGAAPRNGEPPALGADTDAVLSQAR